MSDEFLEDEILENDIDPMDGINQIRRSEGSEEELESSEPTVEEEGLKEEPRSDEDEQETEEPVADLEEPDLEDTSKEAIKEAIKRKFKANGQEFEFTDEEILEQFPTVFGKAMDYTQKTKKLAPYRKMISALEEEGLSENDFNLALDILKGDKNAIKQLAKDKDIDFNDLIFDDEEQGKSDYTPNDYGKSDFEAKIQEIEDRIGGDAEYSTTVNVIDNVWDRESRQAVSDNPDIINLLHNDIKSGVYAKVAPEAAKLQVLDGNSKSTLDYYVIAGAEYEKSLSSQNNLNKAEEMNKGSQEAKSNYEKGSLEAENKRAARSTGTRADKNRVVDYLDDVDEEKFDAWYKKLEQAN